MVRYLCGSVYYWHKVKHILKIWYTFSLTGNRATYFISAGQRSTLTLHHMHLFIKYANNTFVECSICPKTDLLLDGPLVHVN